MEKWIIVLPGEDPIGPYGSRESAERRLADQKLTGRGKVKKLVSDTARFGKPVGNRISH